MSRRPNIIPNVKVSMELPEDLYGKLYLHLYSPLEGKLPYGALREFYSARIREFFSNERLDLAPFAGTEPGAFVVSGPPATIAVLNKTLRGELTT